MPRCPITPPSLPCWLRGLAWLSLACAVVAMTVPFKVIIDDIWVHLAAGQWIWTHGAVPWTDPFSFHGGEYINHAWLASVVWWLAYDAAGLVGLMLLMHLTVGQWIVAHGEVPRTDPMSYVTAGLPFLAHSWLAEVLFYAVERMAGTVGFMLLRFALITMALGLMGFCRKFSLESI